MFTTIVQSCGQLFIILLMPAAVYLVYKILKKAGLKEWDNSGVVRAQSISFPVWYTYVDAAVIIGFVILWLGLSYLAIWCWFPDIQRALFARTGTIFFRGDPHAYCFVLFFFIVFFLCSLGGLIVSKYFPRYDLYSRAKFLKKGLTGGIARLQFPPSFYVKWFLAVMGVFLPLIYLCLNSYARITDNEITLKYVVPPMNRCYDWRDVAGVRLSGFNKTEEAPYLEFTFADGRTVNIWRGMFRTRPRPREVVTLLKMVKEKKIPLVVEPPGAEDRKTMAGYTFDNFLEIYDEAAALAR